MTNRVLWEVVPRWFGTIGWVVTVKRPNQDRRQEHSFFNKDDAIDYAVDACQFWLKATKERSELTIKNRWGKIQDKRTYGDDPEGIKG